MEIVDTSRRYLGFFTRTPPRALEYPWVLEQVDAASTQHVVDLGAGVSVVPLLLSERGHEVVTVDYSSKIVMNIPKEKWNEWGFLDYSLLRRNILSINADFSSIELQPSTFDVVYSVSVIEHMPASVRKATLSRAANILVPRGRIVLTLDLQPNSYRLWNLDRGKVVEPPDLHGTLDEFLTELEQAGFSVDTLQVLRFIPLAGADIALLCATKVKP
jgi:2-polyprenyl-3-methyl-5-hydroxy-6-metoxy-1,4-benzoquinol methylase